MPAEAADIALPPEGGTATDDVRAMPLRQHYVAAMQRRAAALEGEARQLIEARLASFVETHDNAVDVAKAPCETDRTVQAARPSLGPLLEALAERVSMEAAPTASEGAADRIVPSQIDALSQARRVWASVRTQSQVRRSLEQTAEDAGPLNSSRLVNRALNVMGACSPGYLERFLAYVDALSWLEQMGGPPSSADNATSASGTRKPARKPRKPRAKKVPDTDEG